MKRIFLIIVSLALIFFFSSRIREDWQRYRLLIDEVKGLEQRKDNIEKEQEKLEKLLEEGKQEEVLEKEARLMLGLKKKGEEVMMILPPKNSSNIFEVPISTSSDSLSEWFFSSFFSRISQIWYNLIGRLKK